MPHPSLDVKPLTERLDDLKAKNNLKSDYKLALYLGVSEARLSNWRHGRSLPDVEATDGIAKALGMDPTQLLMEVESQRAPTPNGKRAWAAAVAVYNLAQRYMDKFDAGPPPPTVVEKEVDRVMKRLRGPAALILAVAAGAAGWVAPSPAEAAERSPTVIVMSNGARRRRRSPIQAITDVLRRFTEGLIGPQPLAA